MGSSISGSSIIIPAFVSGFVANLVCHPLEYYKTNTQVINNNNINNNIIKTPFKGVLINPVTYGVHYSLYYYSYSNSGITNPFVNGAVSQIFSNVLLNPLWVFRTRVLLGINEVPTLREYIPGLKRSLVPNGVLSVQSGITFGVMGLLPFDPLTNSFISKTLAGVITYPADTLRTRLRVSNNIPFKDIITQLKLSNCYNGVGYYLLKSVPAFVITNYLFEYLKK
jgi:hypothetical protein